MLDVQSLSVSYGRVRAVREAALAVEPGRIVCLVGSNGAGKSSLLQGIMGLVATAGKVSVNEAAVERLPTSARIAAGLALVPEGRHVFPELTVGENLSLGFREGAQETAAKRRAEILDFFPLLGQRIGQMAGSLSGGEQQMLALGRALMSGPKYLLLDEPTLGLAPVMVSKVAEVLLLLRGRGLGLLLAEQNLRMALEIADRGYVMANGAITITGTAAELRANPEVQKSYLGIA